jgi:hypothetical protein
MHVPFRQYDFKIKRNLEKHYIFDIIRKKWLLLTPEEKVRQLWIHYLIFDMHYPLKRINVEKSFSIHQKTKRIDIIYFNQEGTPELIIECKKPEVLIDFKTLEQLLGYNAFFKAKKLIISNGNHHLGIEVADNQIKALESLQ